MARLNHTAITEKPQATVESVKAVWHTPPLGGEGTEVKEKPVATMPRTKAKRPPFYKVVMLNDDYTPMDFVVEVLKTIFHQEHLDAVNTMLQIHHKGSAVAGIYTRDVAETKIEIVTSRARKQEYPLQCVMEQE